MAPIVFFVHGTTVRGPALAEKVGQIRDGLADAGAGAVSIEAPPWGDQLGGQLDADFRKALPPEMRDRALTEEELPGMRERLRWDLLLADPLVELRLAAAESSAPAAGARLDIGPDDDLQDLAGRIAQLIDASIRLDRTGLLRGELDEAVRSVAGSGELRDAAAGAASEDDEDELLRLAVDAVIADAAARALQRASFPPPVVLQAQIREDLRVQLLEAFGVDRALRFDVGKWFASTVIGAATEVSRARVTGLVARFLADVLVYVRHGDEIRSYLRAEMQKVGDGPVLAVGHSLGGIALVDLLFEAKRPPNVGALLTAGTQAPLFALMGALGTRDPVGANLPVPWTNVYDPYDLLGFYAGEVFEQVKDESVDSGVSFPWAHSAYWTNGKVHDLMRARLKELSG